jgi:hypothetical protein
MRRNRYDRPALHPATLEDLKMLNFLIGEVPPPKGGEDAWLWEAARAQQGKPMHRLLLVLVRGALEEDNLPKIAANPHEEESILETFRKARSEVFKTICDRAFKRGDGAFFKHLSECIEVTRKPRKKPPVEQFKAAVLQSYKHAQIEAAMRATQPQLGQSFGNAFGAMMNITFPDWQDIKEAMEKHENLPSDFLSRDIDHQKRQIERALKSLGLPYAKKSQA